MSKCKYIIEIDNNVYLTNYPEGDPPRTIVRSNAAKFSSLANAKDAIKKAKHSHPFKEINYKIIEL